jgi:hypothetical protein
VKSWFVAVLVCVAAHASADDKADLVARCTKGVSFAKKNDLPRASLYLAGCGEAELPEEVSANVAKAARDVKIKLRDSQFSFITITTEPEGLALSAEISAFPGDTFALPATIWVKGGTYEVTATDGQLTYKTSVTVDDHSRTTSVIQTDDKRKKIVAPKPGKVDMSEGGEIEQNSGPPPAVKRGSLMSKKFQGIAEPSAMGQLEDPLAIRHTVRPPRTLWLGVRLGGGMFDDGVLEARAGAALAGTMRYSLGERYFLSSRFDWSRRGGAGMDVLGASAGIGATITDGSIGVAVMAQLRADIRINDGDAMDVKTFGASAAANLELTLPSTPITAGLRFEQGMTEYASGARDRAVLLEVGVDWR